MEFLGGHKGLSTNEKSNKIEKLIALFEKSLDLIKEKLRLNGLFNKIEDILKNDMEIMTKFSEIRYKLIKTGNTIDDVISAQYPLFFKLYKSVSEDPLYLSESLSSDKKIFNSTSIKMNNPELNNFRQKILEIKKPNLNTENSVEKKNKQVGKNKGGKKSTAISNPLATDETEEEQKQMDNQELLELEKEENRKEFIALIEKDKALFKTDIDAYKTIVKDLKDAVDEDPTNVNMEEFHKRKYLINPETFQSINFKYSNKFKQTGPKKEQEKVNMQQLLAFTKQKRLHFEDLKKIQTKVKPISKSQRNLFSNLPENPDDPNSVKLIKREVVNSLNIDANLDRKRHSINNLLDNYKFHKLEDYDNYIKRSMTQKKNLNSGNTNSKSTHEPTVQEQKRNIIYNTYLEYYKNIQNEWDKEEEQEKIKAQIEKERKIESRKFLSIIKQTKRKAQLYIDPYSIRDEKLNKDLIQINNLLGKEKVNQYKLNRKIEDYTEEIIHVDKKKQQKIEIQKLKEQEERERIIAKMSLTSYNSKDEDKVHERFFGDSNHIILTPNTRLKYQDYKADEEYERFKKYKDYVISKGVDKGGKIRPLK